MQLLIEPKNWEKVLGSHAIRCFAKVEAMNPFGKNIVKKGESTLRVQTHVKAGSYRARGTTGGF